MPAELLGRKLACLAKQSQSRTATQVTFDLHSLLISKQALASSSLRLHLSLLWTRSLGSSSRRTIRAHAMVVCLRGRTLPVRQVERSVLLRTMPPTLCRAAPQSAASSTKKILLFDVMVRARPPAPSTQPYWLDEPKRYTCASLLWL